MLERFPALMDAVAKGKFFIAGATPAAINNAGAVNVFQDYPNTTVTITNPKQKVAIAAVCSFCPFPNAVNLNSGIVCRAMVSTDGGTTFTAGAAQTCICNSTGNNTTGAATSAFWNGGVVPTGDIQAKMQYQWQANAAGNFNLTGPWIVLIAIPFV